MLISTTIGDYLIAVLEVEAQKPCDGERKLTSGVVAQFLNICGPTRTCKPCVARSFISEAEGLVLRR